ncbi:murein biosynthesis integral membrane protein MurJ [Marinilactibacillus psychrotolerans]|uniref:Probable lipid II flippase MurJ n=1 Tax=Marinilactibacillus psychrotolerans TaxID=191770 RepID=A0A5R9BZP8_9LACT|nr:murein biosynthesis integral membrane protein MurJ [Marinilactibacillus psychrotolerans]TLQ05880.1 murein biosynthesis integral membrane protein MurJ [Marinilactibacillus psychrotolerans]
MKRTALILMIITIVSKLLGFGREMALSYFYGASITSDAYLISLTIPNVIFSFIGVGIYTGFIPIYTDARENKSKQAADFFTSNLINILFLVSTIIIILGQIFTEEIVLLFASGFDKATLDIAVNFTRVTFWGIYLTGTMFILRGYLEINKKFILSAVAAIPMNILIIITIIYSADVNINILSYGYIIALISQFVLLIPTLIKLGYHHKFIIKFKDENIRKIGYMISSLVLGVSVNQINVLIDRNIASNIVVGGISVLNYANRINDFVQGVFITTVLLMVFPMMSEAASKKDKNELINTTIKTVNSTTLLVIPSMIGIMFLSTPIVSVLFGRGEFNTEAIRMTSSALFFYSIGIVGVGLREVFSKVFYAMQDTKTPVINAGIGMVLNIVLNVLLSKYIGLDGLALATSISALVTSILLYLSFRKRIGAIGFKQIGISFLKILFASLVMGGLAKLSFNYLTASLSQNLSLFLAIGVGAISYFVIIYFMKIEDVDVIAGAIKKKFGKGKLNI